MIFTSGTLFHVYLPWVDARLAKCLNRYLNVKVVVAAFNQERPFSVIVKFQSSRRFVSSSSRLKTIRGIIYLISYNQEDVMEISISVMLAPARVSGEMSQSSRGVTRPCDADRGNTQLIVPW